MSKKKLGEETIKQKVMRGLSTETPLNAVSARVYGMCCSTLFTTFNTI